MRARLAVTAAVALLALTGCEDTGSVQSAATSPATASPVATTAAPAPPRLVAPPATTRPPAPVATTRPPAPKPTTAAPAPVRTTAKPAALSTCGAPANPWGYNFCGRGSFIRNPKAAFCDYFDCIASFWESTNGYVMRCDDGMYSHSGGRSGSCSHHDGNDRPLFG